MTTAHWALDYPSLSPLSLIPPPPTPTSLPLSIYQGPPPLLDAAPIRRRRLISHRGRRVEEAKRTSASTGKRSARPVPARRRPSTYVSQRIQGGLISWPMFREMEAKAAYERELVNNLMATELRLGLPGSEEAPQKVLRRNKRPLSTEVDEESGMFQRSNSTCTGAGGCSTSASSVDEKEEGRTDLAAAPEAKAQVVGWPPVRTYRKSCLQAKRTAVAAAEGAPAGRFVKVSMDGAPYLRKIDLSGFRGYKELREALESMFKCFSIGFSAGEAHATSDYAITYEDKDGDWMLAGDVPWEMFSSSCRRLRVMKGKRPGAPDHAC